MPNLCYNQARMPKIVFLPMGVECVVTSENESVFQIGRQAGVMIDTACGGKGTCGLCRVRVVQGSESLIPMNYEEKKFIGTMPQWRLSCRIMPTTTDLVIEVPLPRTKKKKSL